MKLTKTDAVTVYGGNEQTVTKNQATQSAASRYQPLVLLIAQMCDAIAAGEDMFMIIGATSRRDAYVLTVKQSGVPTSVYAPSLEALCDAAKTLL